MSRASDAGIAVRNLSKGYGEGPVLDGLSFDLPSGETLSVIGPSGCGKSTLLYLLAGLDKPDRVTVSTGEVSRRDGKDFVYPHWRGSFRGRRCRRTCPCRLNSRSRIRPRAGKSRRGHAGTNWGWAAWGCAIPRSSREGQRQRVADRPGPDYGSGHPAYGRFFSSLDALTREHLQTTVLSLWQRRRPTCVLVTHNVPEAVFLGKHVMVMNGHPARNVMWLENPCFGDADPRGEERYFSLTKKVYAALSETKDL